MARTSLHILPEQNGPQILWRILLRIGAHYHRFDNPTFIDAGAAIQHALAARSCGPWQGAEVWLDTGGDKFGQLVRKNNPTLPWGLVAGNEV